MLFCYFIFQSKRPSPFEADGGVKAAGVEPAPRDWPLWNGKNGMCWIDLDRFGSMINTLCHFWRVSRTCSHLPLAVTGSSWLDAPFRFMFECLESRLASTIFPMAW